MKRRLREGEVCVGTLIFEFGTTGISRIAAGAGADFVLFDQEHTGWTSDLLRMLLATSRAVDCVPLVRVPAAQYHLIAQALDLGAMGVMVPMVDSAEQAELVVRCAKYPPVGRRGAAFGVAHDDYVPGEAPAKMESANRETLLIVQIETVQGLEDVERIAAVPGIDVLWIGQSDLTASMGIPAQFMHERYLAAVERVGKAAAREGRAAGFMVGNADEAGFMLSQGFRCLGYSSDIWIYAQALRAGIEGVRKAAAAMART